MQIIYGYSNCTDSTYRRIVSERNASVMVPDQKYHGLLIKGLAKNGAEVRCFSGLPVNRAVTSRKLVREPDEQEGNAHFHYITTVNFPGIRQLMIFFGTFFGVLKIKKGKDTFAICDFLNSAVAFGMVCACRLRRIKVTAIVTDLPDMFDKGKLRKVVGNFLLKRFDGYVLLTEYMREFLNRSLPCIVLEGHVDSDFDVAEKPKTHEELTGTKVVVYAGNIHAKYGIEYFAKGFLQADIPGAELWLYGHGDYQKALEEMAREHPNIRYMGVKPNSEIVAEEQRASLLVNPRPTAPEYTKYSFPSKNMEYMASGTPMLTTKLPGMPDEYIPYVYLIEEETEQGIADALKKVFAQPFEARKQKAEAARRFVLENKSNVVQAKKIIDFLRTIK